MKELDSTIVDCELWGIPDPVVAIEFPGGERYEVRPRDIDLGFAGFIARLAGRGRDLEDPLWQAAFIVSLLVGQGQVRCDIGRCGGGAICLESGAKVTLPPAGKWRRDLAASGVVGGADPDEAARFPLVLDGECLYLQRFWRAEVEVAAFVAGRLRQAQELSVGDSAELAALCARLFPATDRDEIDWQQVAALAALVRPFLVISGGPGSGKTYTVARIIALLRHFAGEGMRVALAAPTGKAASRLRESVAAQSDLLATEGLETVTLHRLLGLRPGGVSDFGPTRPLPYDLVVVDEASMVDLTLMHVLVRALAPDCRLILLGDHRQLAAVEPGAVFAAFCRRELVECFSPRFSRFVAGVSGATEELPVGAPAGDGVVLLRRSRRFGAESGIGRLARAVAGGDGAAAVEIVTAGGGEIEFYRPGDDFAKKIVDFFKERPGFWRPESLEEAFSWLGRLRVLCPARSGPRGVEEVNRLVFSLAAGGMGGDGLVPGQPLMVRRNDYHLGLFNGDIGVASPAEDPPRVFFPDEGGGVRSFSPFVLPEWETVYAMTVHKSQGSEFDEVLLILPEEAGPLMTRELFYTAITRAREKVHVWGDPELIRQMVECPPAVAPALAARLEPCLAGGG